MKSNTNFIIGDDGRMYYGPGDSHHNHLILVTQEDRIQILEADMKNLEERIASLEKKASEK
jgi:hypothetical protein